MKLTDFYSTITFSKSYDCYFSPVEVGIFNSLSGMIKGNNNKWRKVSTKKYNIKLGSVQAVQVTS